MTEQWVLQCTSVSHAVDYDRLLSLEPLIEGGLGALGIVDGYDVSAGEMNVLIHTE